MNLLKLAFRIGVVICICLIWWATNSLVFSQLAWEHSLILKKLMLFTAALALISVVLWLIGRDIFGNVYLFLLLFTACYFLIRLPFYVKPFEGEDTILAEIFINNPSGPFYWIRGQVDGQKYYNVTYHPGLSYAMLELMGKLTQYFMDFKQFDNLEVATRVRFVFSLCQYLFFIIFTLLASVLLRKNGQNDKVKPVYIFLLVMALTPIAIENSIDLQIDSTSGILIAGIFFISIVLCISANRIKSCKYLTLFIGAMCTGFGKNEWGIMFFAALMAYLTIEFIRIKWWNADTSVKQVMLIFLISLGGAVAGNIINYLFDQVNYAGGLKLLAVMVQNFSIPGNGGKEIIIPTESVFIIRMTNNSPDWSKITLERLPYIFSLILLLIFMGFSFIKNLRRIDTWISLGFIYAMTLFFSFFISSWGTFIRYFAPSFTGIIVVLYLFLTNTQTKIATWQKITFYSLCLLMTIRLYSLELNLRGKIKKDFFEENNKSEVSMESGCIHPVIVTVNKPTTVDYYINYYGFKSLDELQMQLKECSHP